MPLITSVPRQRSRMRATCVQSRWPRSPNSRITPRDSIATPRSAYEFSKCGMPWRRSVRQERAEQPPRPRDAVPREAQARLQRAREAGAQVVLAIRRGRRVDREHQRAVSRLRDAVDQRVDARRVARQVRLEPGVRILGHDLLEPDQRRSRDDHRDVRLPRAAREHEIAAVRRHRADAHRPDAEGMRVGLAQQLDRLRAIADADEHARDEAPLARMPRGCRAASRSLRRRPRRS